ncbi:hypothetical protein AB0442_38255 [Kitasatospora sp. NPDC085895]|uniref:hypothetical protein n=1 Tax=Kitasatospora sp. NPDC085895 TaxID=3155057 RepID=UPI00344D2D39
MTFNPGGNEMLFGAPACAVCGGELKWGGRGRRPEYCSRACSSKAARDREKRRHDAALAAAAESSREETGAAEEGTRGELLNLADQLRTLDTRCFAELDSAAHSADVARARQALEDLTRDTEALFARYRQLAQQLFAEWQANLADEDPSHPAVSTREEMALLPAGATSAPV